MPLLCIYIIFSSFWSTFSYLIYIKAKHSVSFFSPESVNSRTRGRPWDRTHLTDEWVRMAVSSSWHLHLQNLPIHQAPTLILSPVTSSPLFGLGLATLFPEFPQSFMHSSTWPLTFDLACFVVVVVIVVCLFWVNYCCIFQGKRPFLALLPSQEDKHYPGIQWRNSGILLDQWLPMWGRGLTEGQFDF